MLTLRAGQLRSPTLTVTSPSGRSALPMPTVMSPSLARCTALHAPARGDRDVTFGHMSGPLEVAREHTHSVAAHLRDRAVAVAVVHEPLRLGRHLHGLGVRGGPHDMQQTVAADARAAVAQGGDGGRGQVDGVLRVRDDHEVVLGPVPLEEGDPRAHPSIVRGRSDTPARTGRRRRPGPAQQGEVGEPDHARQADRPAPHGYAQRSRATRHTASTTTAATTTTYAITTRQSGRRPEPRCGRPGQV